MTTVYGFSPSGNCHKVRLILEQTGRPYVWKEIDILKGESRTPEFLAINANGKIPAVVLEDGRPLAESNAILLYFAEGTPLIPSDPYERAKVYEWLFFEQYTHEPNVATARYIVKMLPNDSPRRAEVPAKIEAGYRALDVMEKRLSKHPFLVGDYYTVADIALFAYTHVAGDAGMDLSRYPGILAWIRRVEEQPGYVKMAASE